MFTVATRRSKEGLAVVYQSIKFVNGVWALAELTFQEGNSNIKASYFINNLIRWVFQFLRYSLKYFRLCTLISFIRRSKMLIIITVYHVIQFTLQLNGMQGRIIKRAATAPIRKVLGSIVVLAELPSVPFTLYESRGLGCVSLPTCPVSLHGDDTSLPPPCQTIMLNLW